MLNIMRLSVSPAAGDTFRLTLMAAHNKTLEEVQPNILNSASLVAGKSGS